MNKASTTKYILDKYLDRSQPIGEAVRYADCPFCNTRIGRKGFIVTRTARGFLMFCHRCHAKRFIRCGTPSYSDCLRTAKEAMSSTSTWTLRRHANRSSSSTHTQRGDTLNCDVQFVRLPHDVTRELPTRAQMWLKKYNVTQEEINTYNFFWSNQYERLILPVYKSGKLVYWQGRYFGMREQAPKYINTRNKRTEVWFDTGGTDAHTVVLVEDILSAIAVSRVSGYRAVALLGCYLSDVMIARLQSEGKQVCVWLDLDKQSKSRRYSKRLQVFGLTARSVVTPKDPKEYTPEQIRGFLEGTNKNDTSNLEEAQSGSQKDLQTADVH